MHAALLSLVSCLLLGSLFQPSALVSAAYQTRLPPCGDVRDGSCPGDPALPGTSVWTGSTCLAPSTFSAEGNVNQGGGFSRQTCAERCSTRSFSMLIFQDGNSCYCLTQLDVRAGPIDCKTSGAREVFVWPAENQAESPAATKLTNGPVTRLPSCGSTRAGTCPGAPYAGSPSFTGAACLAANTFTSDNVNLGETTSRQDCAMKAAKYPMFLIQPNGCYGISRLDVPNPAIDCSTPDAREFFVHSIEAQASGLARRQLQVEVRRSRKADNTLCPASLTACRVSGTEDGYECLDTQTELESCGGCLHGVFSGPSARLTIGQRPVGGLQRRNVVAPKANSSHPLGTDCSDRKHFAPGTTCHLGICVSFFSRWRPVHL